MKKKVSLLLMIAIMVITMVGCGVQNKYLKSMKAIQEYNFMEYKMSIDDIVLGENAKSDMSLNAMVTQLKDINMSGNILTKDKDDSSFKMNISINALGSSIPLEIISDGNNMYLSANYITAITELVSSSLGAGRGETESSNLLKDKYIDLSEISKEDIPVDKEKLEEDTKKMNEIVQKHIEEMDESKFSEKDGTITCKFEKEDIMKLIKEGDKYLREIYPSAENFDEDILSNIDIFELHLGINESDKNSECIIKVGVDNKVDSVQTISLKIEMKHSDSKDELKMPSKDNIITLEEAENIIGNLYNTELPLY